MRLRKLWRIRRRATRITPLRAWLEFPVAPAELYTPAQLIMVGWVVRMFVPEGGTLYVLVPPDARVAS